MAEDQAQTNTSNAPHQHDRQRIAIVGGGVSGLVCAHLLAPQHDVTLYEARERLGGHTHTHALLINDQPLNVDTGFIVYNPRNYPLFCKLLENLGVEGQDTAMSFSVEDGKAGLIYNGTDLNGLFAQRKNLINPRFWGLLKDMWRFNQDAKALANASETEAFQTEPDDEPLHAFLARNKYGQAMIDQYLLPMGSAIWSTDIERFKQFPAKFLAEFLNNHGMLDLVNRPVWRTVVGGSNTYVKALVEQTPSTFLTNHPVQTVRRLPDGIECLVNHQAERFDHVIFACHSNQTLAILADPTAEEERALSGVPYQPNQAVLHTDIRCMPPIRRAWAAWNYHLPSTPSPRATLSYNMNILQKLPTDTQVMVTLNPMPGQIDPEHVLQTIEYQHPLYTTERATSHKLWDTINHQHHTSFCGAYWGHGFHEDGVRSAVKVCERFGVSL